MKLIMITKNNLTKINDFIIHLFNWWMNRKLTKNFLWKPHVNNNCIKENKHNNNIM